ncbi:unnamed protein product, partial [Urochloa humidicola]
CPSSLFLSPFSLYPASPSPDSGSRRQIRAVWAHGTAAASDPGGAGAAHGGDAGSTDRVPAARYPLDPVALVPDPAPSVQDLAAQPRRLPATTRPRRHRYLHAGRGRRRAPSRRGARPGWDPPRVGPARDLPCPPEAGGADVRGAGTNLRARPCRQAVTSLLVQGSPRPVPAASARRGGRPRTRDPDKAANIDECDASTGVWQDGAGRP